MLLINILLALVWIFLTGIFSPLNLVLGFAISFLMIWLVEKELDPNSKYTKKFIETPKFILFFIVEVIKANLRVTYEVLSPKFSMQPGIVAYPLDAKTDLEITLLANLITLTPGTLSLDVSADRKTLYVHAMFVQDKEAFKQEIKQTLETPLLRLLR